MNKIPVGHVIAQSYTFAFRKYFSVLGVVWLPTLLALAFTYFVVFPHMQTVLAQAVDGRPHRQLAESLGIQAVNYVLIAIMSVGITKEVLGLRKGPRFVYIAIGLAELRVLAAYIVLLLLGFVFAVVLGLVFGLFAVIAAMAANGAAVLHPSSHMVILFVLTFVTAVLVALLFFGIRLSSFLTAVSVAERRFGLWRSWALTRGNVWRLLAIVVVALVPLFIVELAILAVVYTPVLVKLAANPPVTPQDLQAFDRIVLKAAIDRGPIAMLLFLPLAPIFQGLMIAPAAFAYRALVPAGADAATVPGG